MPTDAPPTCKLRAAQSSDTPLLLQFIHELAEYERLSDHVIATEDSLRQWIFGARPAAEALICECDGEPAGFAVYFYHFSTFVGRPGLYLEDLYIRPRFRGRGLGRAVLRHLAQLAVARGCQRFEWAVLDWNQPAIDFYRSLGAEPMSDWRIFRLAGEALRQLGQPTAEV